MKCIIAKLLSRIHRRISRIKWQCVPWLLVGVLSASPAGADITNDVSQINSRLELIRNYLQATQENRLSQILNNVLNIEDDLSFMWENLFSLFHVDSDGSLHVEDSYLIGLTDEIYSLISYDIINVLNDIDHLVNKFDDYYVVDSRWLTDPAIDWVQGKADLSGLVVELGDVDNDIWGQLENTTLHVDLGAGAEVTAHIDNWDEFDYGRWANVFAMSSSMLGTGIFDDQGWDFDDSHYAWKGPNNGGDPNNLVWHGYDTPDQTDWFESVHLHLQALLRNGEEAHHTMLATLLALTGTNGQAAVQNQVENQMDSLSSAESEFNSADFTDRMMPDRQGGLYKGLTEGRFMEKTDWMREYKFKLPDMLPLDFGTWEFGEGASNPPLVLYHEFDVKNSGLADGFEMMRQCSRFLWWLATVWLLWRTWCLVLGVLLKIYNVFMQTSHLA